MTAGLRADIFNAEISFEERAVRLFRHQVKSGSVYGKFAAVFGFSPDHVPPVAEMPLLPVRAFKEARVTCHEKRARLVFRSSGTRGMVRSEHEVADPGLYRESVLRGFDSFYPGNPVIWAYLPGYTDNPDSSLVWMLKALTERDKQGLSCFVDGFNPPDESRLRDINRSGRCLIFFGAAFGLLDLLEGRDMQLPPDSIIIETGGMKTFRREMDRSTLHRRLSDGFGLPKPNIHSEYGMCELLSQAYSLEGDWFQSVPWMKVTIRNPENPAEECPCGEEGRIGVIDLANFDSCSFILTEDRGVAREDGRFRVLGRWNPENLRGCNFMIDQE